MRPFILSKHKEINKNLFNAVDNNSNGRPFLPTNCWRALRQRILKTPELALSPWLGNRCSKIDTALKSVSTLIF